jgi:single-stranded-DNA-specific exonuclease
MIAADPAMAGRKSIVLASERWHPGIIGIVASRLVELYARPVILIAIYEGEARGSGRSTGSFHLYQALKACSSLLSGFGGHKQAAGLQIDVAQIAAFVDCFDAFAAENLQKDDMIPELAIDLQLSAADISLELCTLKNSLQPFGMGNPEPVFMLTGLQLLEQRILDGGHLKLRLQAGGKTFDAIGFRMAEAAPQADRVDVAFNLDVNVWQGRQRLQLKLKGIRAAGGNGGTE